MKYCKYLLILLLSFSLLACSRPLPADRADYVGEWSGKNMMLVISQDGNVAYKRIEGGRTTTINAPLQEFEGNHFKVGLGPMSTTFVVSVPPHQVGQDWKMTVDGVELTRASRDLSV